jgi:hypothetical protein
MLQGPVVPRLSLLVVTGSQAAPPISVLGPLSSGPFADDVRWDGPFGEGLP